MRFPVSGMAKILIVDDDPSHLKLYSWIVERAGYEALTALVGTSKLELPEERDIDVVIQDYRLASELTAIDVAKLLKHTFPAAPILVLSEMPWMPDDMGPHAAAFVHKGEPQQLLDTLAALLHGRPSAFIQDTLDQTKRHQ